MNINPGELSKKIKIVKYISTSDQDGFKVNTENLVRYCYAKVHRLSGSEAIRNGVEVATIQTRFLVRYTSTTIDTSMVILYHKRIYEITYVNNYDDSNEYIEILAILKEMS